MSNATVSVPGIHCDHCKAAIEGAVSALAGVRSAEVSVAERTVTVDYDEGAVDLAAVRDAIEDRGYAVPAER